MHAGACLALVVEGVGGAARERGKIARRLLRGCVRQFVRLDDEGLLQDPV